MRKEPGVDDDWKDWEVSRDSLSERFWGKVNRVPDSTSCWEWQATRHKQGYGMFHWGDRMHFAHRVAFVFSNGPIKPGMDICHKCDNPSRVRPDHLFEGTAQDNARDMVRKGRHKPWSKWIMGSAHCRAKLTETQVLEIRARFATGGINHKQLAAIYGVNPPAITQIINRKNWKHI